MGTCSSGGCPALSRSFRSTLPPCFPCTTLKPRSRCPRIEELPQSGRMLPLKAGHRAPTCLAFLPCRLSRCFSAIVALQSNDGSLQSLVLAQERAVNRQIRQDGRDRKVCLYHRLVLTHLRWVASAHFFGRWCQWNCPGRHHDARWQRVSGHNSQVVPDADNAAAPRS